MASNSETEHFDIQQQIAKLVEENNQLKNQLEEIKNKEEEKNSLKFDFQRELDELLLKYNNEERAKREEEINLLKSQLESKKKVIEELKNGLLLLLTEVNKEKEFDGPICKGDTEDIWDAAEKGSLPAIKFYFNENPQNIHKANENNDNYTPLVYASCYGHLDIAKFLISKKVNIEAISSYGSTPLMFASQNGHLSIMELLLESGADVNAQKNDNWTSLHYAVNEDHLDCVKLLINKGADKTLKNNKNQTPLDFAKSQNKTSFVKYLSSL